MAFFASTDVAAGGGGVASQALKRLDQSKLYQFICDASEALSGAAESLAIVEVLFPSQNISNFHRRIGSANTRDAINLIYSVCDDQHRYGGLLGLSYFILEKTQHQNESWVYGLFHGTCDQIQDLLELRPKRLLSRIEQDRRDATAHFPRLRPAGSEKKPINCEDLWVVVNWAVQLVNLLLSVLSPNERLLIKHEELRQGVINAFQGPLLIAQTSGVER